MLFTYTAKRSIQTGHSSGTEYNLFADLQRFDRLSKRVGPAPAISTSGNQVTINHRTDTHYSITTDLRAEYDVTDILDMREFLDSVSGGETFYIDEDGGENLITEPSFENGTESLWQSSGSVESVVSVDWPMANYALRGEFRDTYHSPYFPVTVGELMYGEGWVDATNCNYIVNIGVTMYDAAYNPIASGAYDGFANIAAGAGLSFIQGSILVPVDSIYTRYRLHIAGTSGYGTAEGTHFRMFRKVNPVPVVLDGGYTETREGNRFMRYSFKVRKL